jgi:CHAT domain-containing protein
MGLQRSTLFSLNFCLDIGEYLTERVVASLWQVDDLATSELMKHFYRAMLTGKMRPAAALRAAQIEMMKQKRWATPYFWAGFTIQGEWR